MFVPQGKPISASQLEAITTCWGGDGPGRFECLAGSLVGWEAFRAGVVPALTGRMHAAGFDARVELSAESPSSIFRPGLNLCEFKWSGQTQRRFSTLKTRLAKFREVIQKDKPAQLLVFTNLDLSVADKQKLIDFLGEGQSTTLVRVFDAAAISQYANQHSALLAGFFWNESGVALPLFRKEQQILCPEPRLVGRQAQIEEIRRHLCEPGRVALLSGGPGVGKTRLAIEALQPWNFGTVVFEAGVDSALLRRLQHQQPNVVLLDEPDPASLEHWIRGALSSNARMVITLRGQRKLSLGPWAADPRYQEFAVEPLSHPELLDLINSIGDKLDPPTRAWLANQARQSLQALTLASRPFSVLQSHPADWKTALGHEEDLRAQQDLSPKLYFLLQKFSLLSCVTDSDLALFGVQASAPEIEQLQAGHWLRRQGSQLQLTSPVLADHLAEKLLLVEPHWEETLLSKGPLLRFLERLAGLNIPSIWTRLHAALQGMFREWEDVESKGRLLFLLSDSQPDLALEQIQRLLTADRDLKSLKGQARRHAVWLLERLLTRRETALEALELLNRLAQAETESYSNSATALLAAALRPMAPAYALGLGRLDFVRAHLSPLILDHLLGALEHPSLSFVAPLPSSRQPLAWFEKQQLRELSALMDGYLRLVLGWLGSNASEASPPEGIGFARLGGLGGGPSLAGEGRIRRLLDIVMDWFEVGEETWVQLLRALQPTPWLKSHPLIERAKGQTLSAEVTRLLASLEDLDPWTELLHRGLKDASALAPAEKSALQTLVEDPDSAPPAFWAELAQGHGQSGVLLYHLGELDSQKRLQARLLSEFSAAPTQAQDWSAFAAYLTASGEVADFLERQPDQSVRALVLSRLPASEKVTPLLTELLRSSPHLADLVVDKLTLKGWTLLSPQTVLAFLQQLKERSSAAAVASQVLFTNHLKHPPLRQWLLELLNLGASEEELPPHQWQELAWMLTQADPELGWELLQESLLSPAFREGWHPLESRSRQSLVESLAQQSLDVLLSTVLAAWNGPAPEDFRSLLPFYLKSGAVGHYHLLRCLGWARSSEDNALFYCELLDVPESPEPEELFWSAVRVLLQHFPPEGTVADKLRGKLLEPPHFRATSETQSKKQLADSIQRQLQAEFPAPAWLRNVLRDLLARPAPPALLWEYDLTSREFLALLADPQSPDRRWVLSRVLRELPWSEARKHVSLGELSELLPTLDLPDRKKRALETALGVWTSSA